MLSLLESIKEMLRIILPKLFEAPFLGFVAVIVFVWSFRRELRLLFGRGDILLSWGERSIRLRDLSKSLDEELDPIRDDIEGLRRSVEPSSDPMRTVDPEFRIGGKFAPEGWTPYEGQLLPIAENKKLFDLIGTAYGGDGESTFALPDLRGSSNIRMPNEDAEQVTSRLRSALESPKFKWRSIERLAAISGLPESRVLELLYADPSVRVSIGKSGRQIAGLKSRVGE
jgi:hypothetical protein